jgi:hypothetical protein
MVMLIAADFIPPANGNTHMMTEVASTAASRPAGSPDSESPYRKLLLAPVVQGAVLHLRPVVVDDRGRSARP